MKQRKIHIHKTLSTIGPTLCGQKGRAGVELEYALQQISNFDPPPENLCKKCCKKVLKILEIQENETQQN